MDLHGFCCWFLYHRLITNDESWMKLETSSGQLSSWEEALHALGWKENIWRTCRELCLNLWGCVQVYAVGGYDGQSRLSSVECYDSFSNRWTEVTPMKEAVSSPAVASCVNKLFVIGGGPDDNTCSDKVSLSSRTLTLNTSCQSQRLYLSCRVNQWRRGRARRQHTAFRNYYDLINACHCSTSSECQLPVLHKTVVQHRSKKTDFNPSFV